MGRDVTLQEYEDLYTAYLLNAQKNPGGPPHMKETLKPLKRYAENILKLLLFYNDLKTTLEPDHLRSAEAARMESEKKSGLIPLINKQHYKELTEDEYLDLWRFYANEYEKLIEWSDVSKQFRRDKALEEEKKKQAEIDLKEAIWRRVEPKAPSTVTRPFAGGNTLHPTPTTMQISFDTDSSPSQPQCSSSPVGGQQRTLPLRSRKDSVDRCMVGTILPSIVSATIEKNTFDDALGPLESVLVPSGLPPETEAPKSFATDLQDHQATGSESASPSTVANTVRSTDSRTPTPESSIFELSPSEKYPCVHGPEDWVMVNDDEWVNLDLLIEVPNVVTGV